MLNQHSLIYLQDWDQYDRIAQIDGKSGELQLLPMNDSSLSLRTTGRFTDQVGAILAFFAADGVLFLRLNDFVCEFTDSVDIRLLGVSSDRRISVYRDGVELYSTACRVNVTDKFDDDLTAFVDDEDFDFGLFLMNVSKSPDRKAILLQHYS
ncbi:MAG: hypothetical protein KF752_08140 [Pirellulaceae bacterium]|nr:hypothetical protein [Pirellulaceae bacterium]